MTDERIDHDEHDEDELPPIRGLAGLSMEREPAHDLWPRIEARIAPPLHVVPRRRRWVPMAAAAAIAAAIAGLIGMRQLQVPPDASPILVSATPADAPPAARPDTATSSTVAMADDAPSRVQGPNRALVKANLKIVKSAEDQLRQALATDPNDQYLQSLLLSTETQKQHLRGLLDRNLI